MAEADEMIRSFRFTPRNGQLSDLQPGWGICYAEKLLISRQDQLSPMHTHVLKSEFIIDRGGATMVVELSGSNNNGAFVPGNGGTVWGDGGDVLVGEVSTVNDDETDTIFLDPFGRFAGIEEDEAPDHLLVSDYATWLES